MFVALFLEVYLLRFVFKRAKTMRLQEPRASFCGVFNRQCKKKKKKKKKKQYSKSNKTKQKNQKLVFLITDIEMKMSIITMAF